MFKGFSFKSLMQLELLVASVLPVTAILILSTISSGQAGTTSFYLFVAASLLCAIIVFFGEFLIIQRLQRSMKLQIASMFRVIQSFLAGETNKRCATPEDEDLAKYAGMLNTLMDQIVAQQVALQKRINEKVPQTPAPPMSAPPMSAPQTLDSSYIEKQLKQLIAELAPILKGDLRVTAQNVPGDVGILAGICNGLVAEVTQFVHWTRYTTEQISGTVGNLLNSALELAQATEMHMQRLSKTTESVEKVVAFIQRLHTTIHVSADNAQRTLVIVQDGMLIPSHNANDQTHRFQLDSADENHFLSLQRKVQAGMQRQVKLLADLQTSAQDHTILAEASVEDLYTFAQRIHRSSADILKAAEQVSGLETLAAQLREAISPLRVREEELTPLTPAQPHEDPVYQPDTVQQQTWTSEKSKRRQSVDQSRQRARTTET